MLRSTFAKVTAAIGAAELLIAALLLPSLAWSFAGTWLALVGYLLAWAVAMFLGSRQPNPKDGRASALVQWPALALAVLWFLGSGVILGVAPAPSVRGILALHGVSALLVFAASVVMRGAGTHTDRVEADLAHTDPTHADLQLAIASARIALSRAKLDAALSQKARTLLDKSAALPRAALSRPMAPTLVGAIRAVEAAPDDAMVNALEIALVRLTQ